MDPWGIDQCIRNNPTAAALALVGKSLLYRSAEDRYAIYEYYDPHVGFPQPPVGDQTMDIIGLLHIYQNITNPRDVKLTQNLAYLALDVVDYINGYPNSGPQNVPDIQYQMLFANLVASVPESEAAQYFKNVWKAYQHSNYRFGNPFYFSYYTSAYLLDVLSWTGVFNDGLSSYAQRASNYNSMRYYMLFYQNVTGILKSYAQPVPVNVYKNGVCSYAYNLLLPFGEMKRIIFSQTEIILTK